MMTTHWIVYVLLVFGATVIASIPHHTRWYYMNGVNIKNTTETDDKYCEGLLQLLERNSFISYSMGNRSNTKGS